MRSLHVGHRRPHSTVLVKMWPLSVSFEDAVSFLHAVPAPHWVVLSVIFLSAGVGPMSVEAVHDFAAYRLQHLDLHGVHYGSRSVVVNMEAKGAAATSLGRKCVLMRWADVSMETVLDLVERGAGSLLLLLPQNFTEMEGETVEEWRELEKSLLLVNIPIPVYFAIEDEALSEIHESLSTSAEQEKGASVTSNLWHILSGYGYQMISEVLKETEMMKDGHVVTLMGKLPGLGVEQRLPTVAIVAHYDAYGAAPSLSHGVDSNGSGVAALLELARLFSRLYSDPKQRPRSNLLFVLTGGGKLNYFGTKSLLEEEGEDKDSLIHSPEYTLCLDSLAAQHSAEDQLLPSLTVHVSKPPKEGSKGDIMLQLLNQSFSLLSPHSPPLPLVHKKIRLSEDLLSWEHERFSLKRLPAATFSALHNHKDPRRYSMFVGKTHVDLDVLAKNVHVLAEGVAHYLYNLSSGEQKGLSVFPGVHSQFLAAWIDFLSSHARSPQLLNGEHPLVAGLEQAMSRYLHEVTRVVQRPDKSDPEFVLYRIPETTLHAHRIKSPIFDLFLAFAIALYVALWYLIVEYFPWARVSSLNLPLKVRKT